jgi:predicted dehydrogenase
MVEVTEKAGVLTHIAFIFRYFPAIQKLIASIVAGDIGKPLHFRLAIMNGGYLNSERPLSWRLQKSEAGGGVLADLGIHLIDILRASLGEIAWIQCDSRTHITERPISPKSLQKTNVDVDDWAVCTLGLEQGGVGIIEVSRVAAGREQSTSIEIYGEKGSLAVDFIKPQEARIFQTKVGVWKLVENNKVGNEYQLAQRFFRNATSLMDYGFAAHFASVEDFLLSIKQKQSNPIDFCSALKNQKVLEAAYKSSTTDGMRIYLKH